LKKVLANFFRKFLPLFHLGTVVVCSCFTLLPPNNSKGFA
jgi:hypothetical protein